LLYLRGAGGSAAMLISALFIGFIILGLFLSMLAYQPRS
jgi:hypothetical protein